MHMVGEEIQNDRREWEGEGSSVLGGLNQGKQGTPGRGTRRSPEPVWVSVSVSIFIPTVFDSILASVTFPSASVPGLLGSLHPYNPTPIPALHVPSPLPLIGSLYWEPACSRILRSLFLLASQSLVQHTELFRWKEAFWGDRGLGNTAEKNEWMNECFY